MRSIANPKILERKAMRTDVRAVAIALIGFLIITSIASIMLVFFAGLIMNGIVYVASSLVGFGFIWFCFKNDFYLGDILYERRAIPRKVLFNATICAIGIIPIFRLIEQGVEWGFHNAGYQIRFEAIDASDKGTLFVLLNTIIFAPIIEEILFRGVVLRILSRYGRNFAIVSSAILFGLYHTDFIELFHAFLYGLLLAYITFRYSIKWSAVIHCTHNLVMSLVSIVDVPWFFSYGFLAIFFMWGFVISIKKFGKVRRFADKGHSIKNAYKYFFTTPAVLIYVIIALVLAVMQTSIVPLEQAQIANAPLTIPLN